MRGARRHGERGATEGKEDVLAEVKQPAVWLRDGRLQHAAHAKNGHDFICRRERGALSTPVLAPLPSTSVARGRSRQQRIGRWPPPDEDSGPRTQQLARVRECGGI